MTKEFEKYASQREQMQLQIEGTMRGTYYHPLIVSPNSANDSVFKKTEAEKETLKLMKNNHKALLRAKGLNPRKVMNP